MKGYKGFNWFKLDNAAKITPHRIADIGAIYFVCLQRFTRTLTLEFLNKQ